MWFKFAEKMECDASQGKFKMDRNWRKIQSEETYVEHKGHSLNAQRQQGEKQQSQQSNKKPQL